ncbi:MAG: S1C family serine protease [Desulfobacterales bacterium]|nr:S1C family serine protease [Desulfobacterales bacterium]
MKKLTITIIAIISYLLVADASYAQMQAKEVLKAVVKVRAKIPDSAITAPLLGTEREGNGILIDSDGFILTIGYLILESNMVEVTDPEGQVIKAKYIGYDYETGFGLIQAEKLLGVAPLKLGSATELRQGDPALVAGHKGSEDVVGVRIVYRGEFVGYWEYLLENAIYTTPPYQNYGGAALIGPDGSLLGVGSIFTRIAVAEFGAVPANMFVPIDLVKPILNDLKTSGRSRQPQKPWLGVFTEEAHGKLFITRVTSGGPGEKSSLQAGDIILKVNQQPVEGQADFYRKVWAIGDAGVEVPISILRETEIKEIRINSIDRYQLLRSKAQGQDVIQR